mmetsp:Transcript_8445/g.15930  ORF Transcript_8445/g.15930 Transcript_8445/m.15930 type:complete len:201 (+) Transcript_8445:216-818(+)
MRFPITISFFFVLAVNNFRSNNHAFALISCTNNVISTNLSTHSRMILRPSFTNRQPVLLKASTDDDINRQLSKAKELLEKTKAKMLAQTQQDNEETTTPKKKQITPDTIVDKKTSAIKSRNEETGLITCDGDIMAALSEEEEWELKGIFDVFENETEESEVSKQLAERDVAASIYNLRLSLQNDDYRKIFDKRNRWIGEE